MYEDIHPLFRKPVGTICPGISWTWSRSEGNLQIWMCQACGLEVADNPTLSSPLRSHYWRGSEPTEMNMLFESIDAFLQKDK